jgi:outer membrane protein assembly factor BamE (lipoprotein component of BamABCDE complex)
MNLKIILLCAAGLSVGACSTLGQHADAVRKAEGDTERVTVGTVQREIKVGMSGADVIEALGSPNVVTSGEQGQEVWVYDKISTTNIRSESTGNVNLLIIGGGRASGASSSSQRTLTVVIKFDENKRVRGFDYHASRY